MLILFELDPNVVRPGWTPLIILVGLGVVMYLLFRSMRRQFRRVHENFPTDDGPAGDVAVTDGPAADDATAPGSGDVSAPQPDGKVAPAAGPVTARPSRVGGPTGPERARPPAVRDQPVPGP